MKICVYKKKTLSLPENSRSLKWIGLHLKVSIYGYFRYSASVQ